MKAVAVTMHGICAATMALAGVSCGSGKSSAVSAAARKGPAYMICSSDDTGSKVVLSSAFLVKNPRDMGEPWRLEFRRYLGQSGNEGAVEVTCNPVASDDAQAELKKRVELLRSQHKQVIETRWSYAN